MKEADTKEQRKRAAYTPHGDCRKARSDLDEAAQHRVAVSHAHFGGYEPSQIWWLFAGMVPHSLEVKGCGSVLRRTDPAVKTRALVWCVSTSRSSRC